jgi:hypothetical protein
MHNPYIEWNPRYEMFSIFHNGGIQAYNNDTPHRLPLLFDTYAAAASYLGCPCKACEFFRDSGAGE